MTLTLDAILRNAGIDPADSQAIRRAFVREHEDTGMPGIHADSTDEEILSYTSQQSARPHTFPTTPPPVCGRFSSERAAIGPGSGRCWKTVVRSRTTE